MNHAAIIKTALQTVPSFSGVSVQLARIEPTEAPPYVVFMPASSGPNNHKGGTVNYAVSFQVAIVHKNQDQAQLWAQDVEDTLNSYCDANVQGIRPTGRVMITEPDVEAPILICNFNLLTR